MWLKMVMATWKMLIQQDSPYADAVVVGYEVIVRPMNHGQKLLTRWLCRKNHSYELWEIPKE